MISKRQRQLLRALDDGPRSGAELAEILGVSRRTVVREVASMSAWLESVGAGSISSDPNYHLMVTSEDAIASILSQDLTDEARVLMCVLSRPGISTAQISGETYLSVRSVRAAMDEINVRLRGVVALEARWATGSMRTLAAWDRRTSWRRSPSTIPVLPLSSSAHAAGTP